MFSIETLRRRLTLFFSGPGSFRRLNRSLFNSDTFFLGPIKRSSRERPLMDRAHGETREQNDRGGSINYPVTSRDHCCGNKNRVGSEFYLVDIETLMARARF